MNTDTFYAATSALCFTLLGFWWVVGVVFAWLLFTEPVPSDAADRSRADGA